MVTNSVILDFGSEKITVLIGSKGANNTLRVAGKAAVPYAGFMFGDWIDRKNLPGVIAKALNDAAKVAGARIDKVYVGVPGEACALVTKEVNTVFNRKRKLKETDVFELHSQGEEFDPRGVRSYQYSAGILHDRQRTQSYLARRTSYRAVRRGSFVLPRGPERSPTTSRACFSIWACRKSNSFARRLPKRYCLFRTKSATLPRFLSTWVILPRR